MTKRVILSIITPMIDSIKQGAKLFLRAAIKAVTGFIIIPMGIFVNEVQPGWEDASTVVKVYTGILLMPMVAFLNFAAPWWDDFDIAD